MSLFHAVRFNLKDMLRRKEFFAALTVSVLLFAVPCILDLAGFNHADVSLLDPAWSYWGSAGFLGPGSVVHAKWMRWGISLLFLVLPFCASLAGSCRYFDDASGGALKFVLPREGRGVYYRSGWLAVFLGGFLVVFLPLFLEQAVLCAAFPLKTPQTVSFSAVTDELAMHLHYFRRLYLNHPYCYNLVYCVIPAAAAGLAGGLSYSLSLFTRKNRFLVVTLPGIVWIMSTYFLSAAGLHVYSALSLISPNIGEPFNGPYAAGLIVLFCLLALPNAAALAYKIHFAKDEL